MAAITVITIPKSLKLIAPLKRINPRVPTIKIKRLLSHPHTRIGSHSDFLICSVIIKEFELISKIREGEYI